MSTSTPKLRCAPLIVMAILSFSAGSASAGAGDDPWVSVTPRAWLSFVDTIDFDFLEKDVVFVPMGGASVLLAPPMLSGFSVIATGLYGEGDGDATFTDDSVGAAVPLEVDAEIERLDVEVLGRLQIPDTVVSLFLGPRYVTFDEEYTSGAARIENDNEVILVEAGAGVAGNLGDGDRHRFFGNLMSGIAFVETSYDDNVFPPPKHTSHDRFPLLDVNVGYQFVPTSWLDVSLRYRFFVLFAEDDFGQTSLLSAQGPELGVSIRF